ncbi:MAG: hypothetical protein IPQ05_23335, partial [Leptospiraceae bacterium]|nr:hypothetical protein [Leptospiraceae bacterium]
MEDYYKSESIEDNFNGFSIRKFGYYPIRVEIIAFQNSTLMFKEVLDYPYKEYLEQEAIEIIKQRIVKYLA